MRKQHVEIRPTAYLFSATAPVSACTQLDQITHQLCENIADDMVGVYLHGSLAMGCFNPTSSDIDLLVVTSTSLSDDARRGVLMTLLEHSATPHPVEISILHYTQITPWRHPAPYDLHFSEMHRNYYTQALLNPGVLPPVGGVDIDLAAHFTVLATRGICLCGAPIDVLPIAVPWADYVDSLKSDFEWSQRPDAANTVYAVLNACRILAAVVERRVLSKAEGGRWALMQFPPCFHTLLEQAMAVYGATSAGTGSELPGDAVLELLAWVRRQLGW
jgi:streptomycin 3"-adenylyltransferase